MDHFQLRDGVLHAEDVPLSRIAEEVGTPVYVYSRATLVRHARVFRDALSGLKDPHIAFAVKSNPNLAVLRVLANEGYGADVVSGGELARALADILEPIQEKRMKIEKKTDTIFDIIKQGNERASCEAEMTMTKVRKVLYLR